MAKTKIETTDNENEIETNEIDTTVSLRDTSSEETVDETVKVGDGGWVAEKLPDVGPVTCLDCNGSGRVSEGLSTVSCNNCLGTGIK